uniref:Uncharacterized protein n=1 Tax=Ciona savignyi TaxID=51511 RepID=H2Z8Q9_CIOSA
NELSTITEQLTSARQLLDRLRACVVASYYASSFKKSVEGSKVLEQGAGQHPAIQNLLRRAATSVLSKNIPIQQQDLQDMEDENQDAQERTKSPSKEVENEDE